jgi:DNA repair protein RadC
MEDSRDQGAEGSSDREQKRGRERQGAGAGRTTIKDLPEIERPRERMVLFGPQELKTVELLAILLRSGYKGVTATALAEKLLARFKTLRAMADASVEELEEAPGVKRAKACQVKAALELALRFQNPRNDESTLVHETADILGSDVSEARAVVKVVGLLAKEPGKECFWALALDSRNKLRHVQRVSVGSLDTTLAHPREVFERAIRAKAAAIVVTHNHPSGDPTPSDDDVRLTRRLVEAGKVLGIRVHDHIIIAGDRSYSFRAHALL